MLPLEARLGPNGHVSYSIVASDLEPRALSSYASVNPQSGVVLKKLEIELPYDPAIPLLGIHTEETHEMPPSSRDEGLLFLHGLERNPGSNLRREDC